jgi:hypothetical protein
MGDTASDEMIDIQIEESLVRETLMTIDSANAREDVLTLAGFFAVLVLTALTGIFGPSSVVTQTLDHEILNHTARERILFASSPISPLNRFLTISLILVQSHPCAFGPLRSTFSCHSEVKRAGITIQTSSQSFEGVSMKFSECTAQLQLFSDRLLSYDTMELVLTFNAVGGQFSNVRVQSTTGVPDHTLFQIYFRVVFGLFSLLFLVFLVWRLKGMPFKLWHLEQKLTIPLLVLAFLFTDPIYIIHLYRPSRILIVWHTIISALFTSYFQFFLLVLFDSLRYKNRKTSRCFFAPKVVFALLHFLATVIHGVSDNVAYFGDSPLERNHSTGASERAEAILNACSLVWIVLVIVVASMKVDVTERYKFNMYLAAAVFSVVPLLTVHAVFRALKLFGRSSLHFAVSFSVQNVFVLLMAYCHWPYEMLPDHSYTDQRGPDDGARAEFLAGVDGSDKSGEQEPDEQ